LLLDDFKITNATVDAGGGKNARTTCAAHLSASGASRKKTNSP